MTKTHTEAASPDNVAYSAKPEVPARLKRHLLAGVATIALLAAGSALTLHAYSADAHLGGPFGASSAARAPTTPIAMPGFADLVTAVKPAVVSGRGKGDAAADRIADRDDANPLEGTPFERFFKEFRGPYGQRLAPGQEGRQPRQLVRGQGSGFFISAD